MSNYASNESFWQLVKAFVARFFLWNNNKIEKIERYGVMIVYFYYFQHHSFSLAHVNRMKQNRAGLTIFLFSLANIRCVFSQHRHPTSIV